MFLFGALNFQLYPQSIRKQYNCTTITEDGVEISFNVFEPKVPSEEPLKKGIIVGHGVVVNKEFMRVLSMDLANNGFVVVSFDFRGHGRSSGNLDGKGLGYTTIANYDKLKLDIQSMKTYLRSRGDVDMQNLGYVGYSMGVGAGMHQLYEDNDFKAMAGIAPAADGNYVNTTNPQNLLICVGKIDEAITIDQVMGAMENKTGLARDQIEQDKLYGSFENGTAAKLCVDTFVDHMTVTLYPKFIEETTNWMSHALNGSEDAEPLKQGLGIFSSQIVFLSCSLLGTLGIFFLLLNGFKRFIGKKNKANGKSAIIEDKTENEKSDSIQKQQFNVRNSAYPLTFSIIQELDTKVLVKKFFAYQLVLSFPAFLPLFLLYFTPVKAFSMMLGILFSPAIVVFVLLWREYAKINVSIKNVLREHFNAQQGVRNLLISLGLSLVFYGLFIFSLGYMLGIVPNVKKLVWLLLEIPIVLLSGLVLSVFCTIFFELRIKKNKLQNALKKKKARSLDFLAILELGAVFITVNLFDFGFFSLIIGNNFALMVPISSAAFFFLFVATVAVLRTESKNAFFPDLVMLVPLSMILLALTYLN